MNDTEIMRVNGTTETNGTGPTAKIVIAPSTPSGGDPHALAKCRLAILGFAPSSLRIAVTTVLPDPTWNPANADRPSYVWGLNELYKVPGISRADLWFDIHDRRDGDISHRDPDNINWLRKCPVPVYMQEHYEDIPPSIRYPIESVVQHFRTNYFTNTISYEIALACMLGRDERGFVIDPNKAVGELHVYGVDMAQDAAAYSEYREQRPSVEYFLGWARALRIKVHIPDESDLLSVGLTGMYGYESKGKRVLPKMRARKQELQEQIGALRQAAAQKIQEANQMQVRAAGMEGALEDTSYWERCHMGVMQEVYSPEDLDRIKKQDPAERVLDVTRTKPEPPKETP